MNRVIVALACVLCAGVAFAAPLSYPVVDTGQKTCYDLYGTAISGPRTGDRLHGQDAQYAGLRPFYQDNKDGTVTDVNTGLQWQKTPPKQPMTFDDAKAYADGLLLGGHNDWRLPTIKALASIVDFSGSIRTRTPYIDTTYFDYYYPDPATGAREIDAQYWSSRVYVGTVMRGQRGAFGFNFADGRIKCYPIDRRAGRVKCNFVRCVRGRTDYGKNAFIDNKDGTVSDHATGLMWAKADSKNTMTWAEALAYAESLDAMGYDDWRLPNAKELQSIVDYSRAPDAIDPRFRSAAIDPVFSLTEMQSWHWTSTTHGDGKETAIYVCFGEATSAREDRGKKMNAHGAGAMRSDPKSGSASQFPEGRGPQGDEIRIRNYVRCVRGGTATPTISTPPIDGSASRATRYAFPRGTGAGATVPFPVSPSRQSTSARNVRGGPGNSMQQGSRNMSGGARASGTGGMQPPSFVSRLDRDKDGYVSPLEFDGPAAIFGELDSNGDGRLSEDEAPHMHGHPMRDMSGGGSSQLPPSRGTR